MSLAGRAHRVLLGLARPGRPAAPRHLVDQLDLPRHRRAAVQAAATGRATSGGWPSCPWASPGTTCTTPTRPAPGTASSPASSTPAPASSGSFEKARLGAATCAGPGERLDQARGGVTTRSRPAAAPYPGRRAEPRRAPPWHDGIGDRSPGQGRTDHQLTVPDDGQAAPRAAHRGRPEAVCRQGFRGHHRRGDRRQGRASPSRSSTSTSAARRACTPSSSTARSRPCSTGSPAP